PTAAMRKAMAEAEVGDDVYGEDTTVNKLEVTAAARLGKEAGLFVVSGSMGNLVSALAWCDRGDELICGVDAHLLVNEMGAIAAFGGIQMRALPNDDRGLLDPQLVDDTISPMGGLFPRTALLCLENTHNRGNGAAYGVAEMQPLADVAHHRGMRVHVDGARIFNAAVALGVPVAELAGVADSVTFCLSKGLSCPVGSVVTGPAEFIGRARRIRKMLGGGMRQAGVITAAGLVALDTMVDRLAEDHANAKRLAEGLAGLPGVRIDPAAIETNIVYAELEDGRGPEASVALKERGVLANGRFNWVRFVTRRGITAEDVDEALDVVASVLRERAGVR
ncbi:MAG: GntG family PLP-dependent aldolase, partial [Dehalococcoidia bacterium]